MVNPTLSLHSLAKEHYALVRIGGEMDIASAPATLDCLLRALARRQARLVVDVRRVVFADATGVGVLLTAGRSAAREGGWVRLVAPGSQLRRVLDILQVTALLPVYESVLEAAAVPPTGTFTPAPELRARGVSKSGDQ